MSSTARQTDRRAVARRGRRASGLAAAALATVVAAGCGGVAEEATEPTLPVAEAQPVPFEDTGLAPPSSPTPAEPSDAPTEAAADADADATTSTPASDPTPESGAGDGPTNADAAAFIASDALADLRGLEHVVVDLDGDEQAEVVATGIKERRGIVRVAWWTSDGYEVLVETTGGPGRDVTDLRAADVNDDETTELLVAVEGEGLASLSVWAVPRRGVVEPLAADGGCHDGSHVYGVTRFRLVDQGEAPPAIVADCDDSPLPVADWSEQRWVWKAGAYRFAETPSPATDDPGQGDGAGGGDGGAGDDGGGDDEDDDGGDDDGGDDDDDDDDDEDDDD